MDVHFFFWSLLVFGAARVWSTIFSFVFNPSGPWPNAAAYRVLGGGA